MRSRGDGVPALFADPELLESGNAGFLREAIARSPEPASLSHVLLRYTEKNGLPRDRQQLLALVTVAGQSPFLGDLLLQNPRYLPWAVADLGREESRTPEDLREDLARFRFTLTTLPDAAVLRRFKHREYLRIALRDFLGAADLSDTTRELSLLADTLLEEAYLLARREALNRYGPPQFVDDQGRLCEATFAILSLGKLGGEELNYSSDIDLVYVYSREGQTSGLDGNPDSSVSNREFFTRLAEGITARIAGISPEGQVFRVDLGLRPGGKDGELVHSRRSFLAYYRTWARTWERQALLKARHSAGDAELGQGLLQDLQSTIYPSGATAFIALEIKEMKDRIDSELSRSGRHESDIKLGRGGIRELEFAVQGLQLTLGSREPWLREGNSLRALHRLADKEQISFGEHFSVSRAYVYLRCVEHRLQLERNRQTCTLPSGPEGLKTLARRLGYVEEPTEVEAFLRDLDHHRSVIRTFYDSVLGGLVQGSLGDAEKDPLLDQVPDSYVKSRVAGEAPGDPEELVRHLKRIRRLFSPERMRPEERREMRRVSATILGEAMSAVEPGRALSNLERFLSSLLTDPDASRSLVERVEWIPPLLRLFGTSEHLSQILTRRPEVLAQLGNVAECFREKREGETSAQLVSQLNCAREVRDAAAVLRRIHQLESLLIGLRDVHRQDSLSRTLQRLTGLAQACLTAADSAAARLTKGDSDPVPFCILGLGRLGYRELDYGSDLDLIFVADPGGGGMIVPEVARRRAETIVHLLTAVTQEGSLYSVDLRLRPAGREGELVQTPEGLTSYFRDAAQTWEKMAFLKARPVAGDSVLGGRLLERIQQQIFEQASPDSLWAEVLEMKERLDRAALGGAAGESIPIKLGPGGILDVHFLIEYLQIRHRLSGPQEKDTLRMLTHLYGKGLIPAEDYPHLYAGYLLLRSLDHAMRLLYDRPGDSLPTSPAVLTRLAGEVSFSAAPERDSSADSLRELLEETRESIRRSFLRLVR